MRNTLVETVKNFCAHWSEQIAWMLEKFYRHSSSNTCTWFPRQRLMIEYSAAEVSLFFSELLLQYEFFLVRDFVCFKFCDFFQLGLMIELIFRGLGMVFLKEFIVVI